MADQGEVVSAVDAKESTAQTLATMIEEQFDGTDFNKRDALFHATINAAMKGFHSTARAEQTSSKADITHDFIVLLQQILNDKKTTVATIEELREAIRAIILKDPEGSNVVSAANSLASVLGALTLIPRLQRGPFEPEQHAFSQVAADNDLAWSNFVSPDEPTGDDHLTRLQYLWQLFTMARTYNGILKQTKYDRHLASTIKSLAYELEDKYDQTTTVEQDIDTWLSYTVMDDSTYNSVERSARVTKKKKEECKRQLEEGRALLPLVDRFGEGVLIMLAVSAGDGEKLPSDDSFGDLTTLIKAWAHGERDHLIFHGVDDIEPLMSLRTMLSSIFS